MAGKARVAIAGAGIYGATAAIRLAQRGHDVTLFDPLGLLQAASAINQYRVHAGYHYPRSTETILEVQETRAEFLAEFAPAIVANSEHLYAIPKAGSLTSVEDFERTMREFGLPLAAAAPDWMDFGYIEQCWRVDEAVYDPEHLRALLQQRLDELNVPLRRSSFDDEEVLDWDFVIWATYGLHSQRKMLENTRKQVAEKILIELPAQLRHTALVVIDGPFTAFDPYGSKGKSLFGSARYTNHWSTNDPFEPIPDIYAEVLHQPEFRPFEGTRFQEMVDDCAKTVPAARGAKYLGSRFAIRVVEYNPDRDQRLLYVCKLDSRNIQIFSGKVVGAVKAARQVVSLVEDA